MEKEMATHSSILAWRIPWTKQPDGPGSCQESDRTEWLKHTHKEVRKWLPDPKQGEQENDFNYQIST